MLISKWRKKLLYNFQRMLHLVDFSGFKLCRCYLWVSKILKWTFLQMNFKYLEYNSQVSSFFPTRKNWYLPVTWELKPSKNNLRTLSTDLMMLCRLWLLFWHVTCEDLNALSTSVRLVCSNMNVETVGNFLEHGLSRSIFAARILLVT